MARLLRCHCPPPFFAGCSSGGAERDSGSRCETCAWFRGLQALSCQLEAHACTRTHTQTRTHVHTHTLFMHTHTQICMHTHTQTHTHLVGRLSLVTLALEIPQLLARRRPAERRRRRGSIRCEASATQACTGSHYDLSHTSGMPSCPPLIPGPWGGHARPIFRARARSFYGGKK